MHALTPPASHLTVAASHRSPLPHLVEDGDKAFLDGLDGLDVPAVGSVMVLSRGAVAVYLLLEGKLDGLLTFLASSLAVMYSSDDNGRGGGQAAQQQQQQGELQAGEGGGGTVKGKMWQRKSDETLFTTSRTTPVPRIHMTTHESPQYLRTLARQ